MNYYEEKQYLAQVDKKDNIIGKVERWEAHEDKILHRAFTACLVYKDQVVMQHRKHVLFDGLFDFTASSHPIYQGDKMQENEDAVYQTFEREWGVAKSNLSSPLENKGFAYYQANDENTEYGEHEVCYLFVAQIDTIPTPNYEYAYGFSLVPIKKLKDKKFPFNRAVVPWVPASLGLL